jgi:hypothetical protein
LANLVGQHEEFAKKRDMPKACAKSAALHASPRPALVRTRLSLNVLLALF